MTSNPAPLAAPRTAWREVIASRPWFAGKAWGVFLMMLYPMLVAAPLLVFAKVHRVSDHMRGAEVGVDCAVVGFTILALQFLITARLSWVEAPFGLDVLLVFHRTMAVVATALLCVHPVLVVQEEGWSLLVGRHARWYVWLGVVALALLLAQLVVSLARRLIRLSFDRWRSMHQPFAMTVLVLGFVHGVTAGDDSKGAGLLVWAAVLVVALGFWSYARLVRPRAILRRPFRVLDVKPEAPRVWTITLKSPEGRPFHFLPGQFGFLRLHGSKVPSEEHPFTIASSPERSDQISVTVKESGDFTSGISRVRPGDLATVHGPFGRFSHVLHPGEEDRVFVAGGVGITPLLSMLRFMRDRSESRSVLLVYACRSAADLLFAAELEAMVARGRPRLKLVPVLAEPPPGWTGESGLLDADRIARLSGGVAGKSFYLCCPPGLMRNLMSGLRRMGVSPRHIRSDYFSL